MTTHWRERAFREVRNELDRFLNFPLNQSVDLGDYGYYDGKKCRFEWRGKLADHGIAVPSAGFQHEITEAYSTAGKVIIQGRLGLSSNPEADIKFRKSTAISFRGHKLGFDSAQITGLSKAMGTAISQGLVWDKKLVVVTQLWRADGFTHLVSGAKEAGVTIEATVSGAPLNFNFADPSMGLQLTGQSAMSYTAVGQAGVNPYFGIHKLREDRPGIWQLYAYRAPAL